ncbi:MAG TPA: S41 family peptidase [Bacteroidia bacterium]|nr:S41 family peptidase [Bacteroidia bacterium]
MKNFILILVFLNIAVCSLHGQSKIDWKSDIEFLKSELPAKHIHLFFSVSKKEFTSKLDNIISDVDKLTDLEVAMGLQRIIAGMGDSHTGINTRGLLDSTNKLPLRLYWFSDGLYVLQTTLENEELLGKKIISINRFKIKVIVDSLSTLITADNSAIVKKDIPFLISFAQLLQYFRFGWNDSFSIEVESPVGTRLVKEIKAAKLNRDNLVSFKPDSVSFFRENQKLLFTDKYSENDSIYYVQYNKCWGREMEEKYGDKEKAAGLPSFAEYRKSIFETINNRPVNKLVFDMRLNSGGSSPQGTDLITDLATQDKINKKGKLFVVIGRATFSSAIINAMDFKSKTNAVFVGEETGGKPSHFGEVKIFNLPSSGLKVNYSTKYFKRTEEDLKTLKPDITIEESFSDFKKGIDPVYEWIVNYK